MTARNSKGLFQLGYGCALRCVALRGKR